MKKLLNCKGLSLIEVIISAMILTILLAGLFAVYKNSRDVVAMGFHKSMAVFWAQARLEEIRAGCLTQNLPSAITISKNATRPETVTNLGAMQLVTVNVNWTE
ncbi:MAG: prepilin-type N-terminal cleavage/methylation domain-containing protein [Candidatus Omnitrophica bacterium]|nr:prepilin-type N-terminal cleavage/methylation domain-containing protein [Candidatus Omnitrophota bacterium]MBU1924807.1 prepilin-type N-terminal cleavage/methylation domain-containing protein [Candidatus Omnitrophota bacterium]MBU2063543.1 prepilin-type N-terminal cleavage/methylation domain-containing protein [Candidatus Omnitrophota bacterium]